MSYLKAIIFKLIITIFLSALIFIILYYAPRAIYETIWLILAVTFIPAASFLHIDDSYFSSILSLEFLIALYLFSSLLISIMVFLIHRLYRQKKVLNRNITKPIPYKIRWGRLSNKNKLLTILCIFVLLGVLLGFWLFLDNSLGISNFIFHYLPLPCIGFCISSSGS